MDRRVSIAGLLQEIQEKSPSGFAIALHVRFSTSQFMMQTYPPEWTEEYTRRGLHLHDPVVKWTFTNTGAIRWRELDDLDTHGVMAAARAYGMNYGVSIGHVAGGSRSIAGCSRADRDYLDVEIDELKALIGQLHDVTAGLSELSSSDMAAMKRMSIRLTRGA